MQTKAKLRFFARLAHYEADVELADVFKRAIKSKELESSSLLFTYADKKRHPRLCNRAVSKQNREIAVGHLNNTIRVSFIKDLYEDFLEYLSEILRAAARNGLNAGRLIGSHKFSVDANHILEKKTWEEIINSVADDLFRELEKKKKTVKLVEDIDKKLGLNLDKRTINAAMPYLEIRHLYVHRDGICDELFSKSYPILKLKNGDNINPSYDLVKKAKNTIHKLVNHIDERVLHYNIVGADDKMK